MRNGKARKVTWKVWWISCLVSGICVGCSDAFAATYYTSPSGSDSNPGSLSLPFRTIQRCANIAVGGDTCFIRTGTYRETVRPSQSGSAGAPITFQAYPGDTVTLTGTDPVRGWTVDSGSIYKAPLSGTVDQVFVDGQMMTWARWPNDKGPDLLHPTLATTGSGTGIDRTAGTETVVDAALSNFPAGYWDNAVIWISAIGYSPRKAWWAQTGRISSSVPGSVTFPTLPLDSSNPHISRVPGPGNGYYLAGKFAALDSPKEWFHDGSNLFIWMPASDNPSHHDVEVRRRDFAFDLSERAYVTLRDVNIFASSIRMQDANHCIVDHVNVQYVFHANEALPNAWGLSYDRSIDRELWALAGVGYSGIIMTGSDNQLLNSRIGYSAGNGVVAQGPNHRIENNLIHDVNYLGGNMSGVRANGRNITIRKNTIYNSGRALISSKHMKRGRIELNNLYNSMIMTTDGASVYTDRVNGEGTIIAYNWIHDTMTNIDGRGVYLDNASGGYVIHHNVFWKMVNECVSFPVNSFVDTSSVTYTANDNYLFNNTFYDCGIDIYLYQPSGADMWTQKIYNNIFTDATELRSGADVSNNIYRGTDPRFVNPAAFNFQLQPGSPAIDTGRVIPGITDGHVGSAPDVGAYEFGAPPWTPGHSDVTWADPFPFPGSMLPSSPSPAPSAPSGTSLWPCE
jgi:Right handed beta helix region